MHHWFAPRAWVSGCLALGVLSCAAPQKAVVTGSTDVPVAKTDLDNDGVPDDRDRCLQVVEDFDGYKDEDGCPELDNDADGFVDGFDRCPLEAETVNSFQDDDGCPDVPPPPPPRPPPLRIDLHVRFATRSAVIDRRGKRLIRGRICPLLRGRLPHDNLRVDVVGFSDDRGGEDFNRRLSTERAQGVSDMLRVCGVPTDRLEFHGMGDARLICPDNTFRCRSQNRRVEFMLYPFGSTP